MHIGSILKILWSCIVLAGKAVLLILLLPLHWRRIRAWIMDLRDAKREDKEQGIKRRKRQYVTRYILRAWKVGSERRKRERDLDGLDVEEQRVESITESDGNGGAVGSQGSVGRDDEQPRDEGDGTPPNAEEANGGSGRIIRSDHDKGVS